MKKIIILLSFVINCGLVAMDGKKLEEVWTPMDLVLKAGSITNLAEVSDHVKTVAEGSTVDVQIKAQLGACFKDGLKAAKLKDVFMNSPKSHQFGYVCVIGLAVYGAFRVAVAIRNKLRGNDQQ